MRLSDNPSYRPREPWRLSGRSLWVWQLLLAAVLVALLVLGRYVEAGVFAALWVIAEVVRRRPRR